MSITSNAYKPWYRIEFIDHEGDKHFIRDTKKLKNPKYVRDVVGDDPRDLHVVGNVHAAAPGKNLIMSRKEGLWYGRDGTPIVWDD